jgi:hypothetical protein
MDRAAKYDFGQTTCLKIQNNFGQYHGIYSEFYRFRILCMPVVSHAEAVLSDFAIPRPAGCGSTAH